jgi:hypothetical protein
MRRVFLSIVTLVVATFLSKPAALGALVRGDVRWLDHITFGIDEPTISAYQRLGREKFLDEQLHPAAEDSPELAARIAAIPVTQQTAEARV